MEIKKQLSVYVLCLFACTFFFTGCKKDVYDPNKNESKSNDFTYETRSVKSLDIDYGVKGYKAVFEVYTENPIVTENGVSKKDENIKAPFKAYTDEDCQYTGSINLPTATDKVYLYSENLGLPLCVELEVGENGVQFNMDEYIKKLQSTDAQPTALLVKNISFRIGEDNPYNISTPLGKWDYWGVPLYLVKDLVEDPTGHTAIYDQTPNGLMERVNNTLFYGKDNSEYESSSDVINIKVTQDAKVNLVFMDGKGQFLNAIGYYYYEQAPKDEEAFKALPKYIVFPYCKKADYQYGAELWLGNRVNLKYYGKDGKDAQGSDIFPKGTTIGWFLLADGYKGAGTYELDYTQKILCSNNVFNEGNEIHCATMYDQETDTRVIAFEDDGDKDYRDAVFYLDVEKGTIGNEGKPTDPDVPFDPITGGTTSGTLAFEDLWPNKGDYDMNDVVITYERSYTSDKDNKIIEIQNTFTPIHRGGQIQSAFGYQIGIKRKGGLISDIQIENKNTTSAFVENNMEVGQEEATFILFDDMEQAVKNGPITLKITLEGITIDEIQDTKFYNPFICTSRNKGENPVTAKSRREIHLTNYPPTNKADQTSDFGKYDDRSNLDESRYYVGDKENPYPFAIDLPIMDYVVPTEAMNINDFYTSFKNWVSSKGQEDADWYMYPTKK